MDLDVYISWFTVDIPLVRGCNSTYIVDRLSKHLHFIHCSSSVTDRGVAHLFINHHWKLDCFSECIATGRDPKYVGPICCYFTAPLNSLTTAKTPEMTA